MNKEVEETIRKKIWGKMTAVDEAEYNRHTESICNDSNYGIGTLNCKFGHFIFQSQDAPSETLLDLAIKKNICP